MLQRKVAAQEFLIINLIMKQIYFMKAGINLSNFILRVFLFENAWATMQFMPHSASSPPPSFPAPQPQAKSIVSRILPLKCISNSIDIPAWGKENF